MLCGSALLAVCIDACQSCVCKSPCRMLKAGQVLTEHHKSLALGILVQEADMLDLHQDYTIKDCSLLTRNANRMARSSIGQTDGCSAHARSASIGLQPCCCHLAQIACWRITSL